jgi:branched-subunit amino acid ABC-type transport system permease component
VSQLLGISPQRLGMLALISTAAIGGLGRVHITPAQYTSFDVDWVQIHDAEGAIKRGEDIHGHAEV